MDVQDYEDYEVGLWSMEFYLINDDGDALLNDDGSVKLFDAPDFDFSSSTEGIEPDDLVEIKDKQDTGMKYWIADIEDVNGEFEYKQPIIFKAKTKEEADKIHYFHTSTWYGEDHMVYDENHNCFYNEYIAVREGAMTQIDEHTFNQLQKHHMPDMTPKIGETQE
tara:strand:- start:404 stop:898 length:495 start_codon:yes stop_codon:yes gene_type:complete